MAHRSAWPLAVLVVEDEALLAMDIEAIIEDAGHCVVAEGASLHDVVALDETLRPDLAFVDLQLAKGTSGIDVCALIRVRWPGTMVVFLTANPLKIPSDFAGAHGLIAKPFSRTGLLTAMRYIAEGVVDPPPLSAQPSSFVASPALTATWAERL
jgi:CheY-like chemotaxis protein